LTRESRAKITLALPHPKYEITPSRFAIFASDPYSIAVKDRPSAATEF
jgi:hypothetical protein